MSRIDRAEAKSLVRQMYRSALKRGADHSGELHYSDFDVGEYGRALRRSGYDSALSFEYVNRQGEITIRTLYKWVEYSQYLLGWREDAGDNRTFRKDRVLEWFVGREELSAPKGRGRL